MLDTVQDVVKVCFYRKPCDLEDLHHDIGYVEKAREVEVEETVTLTTEEYAKFTSCFYDSQLPCSAQIFRVVCEDKPTLIVNTEGFNYARYVAVEV